MNEQEEHAHALACDGPIASSLIELPADEFVKLVRFNELKANGISYTSIEYEIRHFDGGFNLAFLTRIIRKENER